MMRDCAGFEIRRAGINDLRAVMVVMNEAFDPKFGEAWTAAQCESMLVIPGSWMLLATVEMQPAAFALMRSFAGEAEILLIATRPLFQRRAIGKALIDELITDCKSANVNLVHLEVRADNPALSFYKRTGFEQVGFRPDYYRGANGTKSHALTLSMQLK
jgi:[ribosomal protein S18]-alanine N-acetyltransferase